MTSNDPTRNQILFTFSRSEEGYPDYRTRRAEEQARRRIEKREQEKKAEQAKEELYDKMMNPHLYGPGDSGGGRGGYRRVRPGEHYEDVQKKELDHEIRMREREERRRREHEKRMKEQEYLDNRYGGYHGHRQPHHRGGDMHRDRTPLRHRDGYRDDQWERRAEYHRR